MAESARSPWLRRTLKGLAWLVGAFVAWMLILNLALWTGLVSWIVTGDYRMSSLHMKHGFAWVLWPTTVHVNDFELTIDAYRYQLALDIPKGEVDIELLALLQRRVHSSSIRGEGIRAVFRYKAPQGKVSEKRRALFGEIEHGGEPIRLAGPPNLPPVDKAWSIRLQRLDGQFSSIWVNEFQFRDADVRLVGALRIQAGNLLAVDHAQIEAKTAALDIGGEPVAKDWSGTIALDVADYDPFSMMGKDVIGQLSSDVELQASMVDISPLAALSKKNVTLRDGAGPLRVRLHLDGGVVQPQTDIDYRADRIGLGMKSWRGHAKVHVSVLGQRRKRAALRVGADLWGVTVDATDNDVKPASIKHLSAYGVSNETDLTKKLGLDGGHAIGEGVSVPNIALFAGAISKVKPKKGSVEASFEVDLGAKGRLSHQLDAKVRGVTVVKGETTVGVGADLHAAAESSRDLSEGSTRGLDLDLHDITIDSKNGSSQRTWVKLHRDTKIKWDEDGNISGTLRGRLDDLRIVLAHAGQRTALVERVPDLEATNTLDFVIDVRKSKAGSTFQVRKLDRAGLHVEGIRRSRKKGARAAFRLTKIMIGYTSAEDGSSKVHALANEKWMREQEAWVREL